MKINLVSYYVVFFVTGVVFGNINKKCTLKELGGEQPWEVCMIRDFIEVIKKSSGDERIRPAANAYIFFGKRGLGKTTIGQSLANELNGNSAIYRANELLVNPNSAAKIADIYKTAEKFSNKDQEVKKGRCPYIIVIDDIDDWVVTNVETQLAQEKFGLDQLRKEIEDHSEDPYIITILISNNYLKVEPRLRSRCIGVKCPLPDWESSLAIIKFYADRFPNCFDNDFLKQLASDIFLFSGRDVKQLFTLAWAETKGRGKHQIEKGVMLEMLAEFKRKKDPEFYNEYGFMCRWFGCYCD